MSERPLIHVVIPTRERVETLESTLRTCLDQDDENFRILVSDNCSQDETQQFVSSLRDVRVKYVRTPTRVSMSENFEFALSQVEDGYVFVIGDDDALLPSFSVDLRRLLEETGAEVILPNTPSYYWSDHPSEFDCGILRNLSLSQNWQWVSGTNALQGCVKRLHSAKYFYQTLPSVYHGCVHTKVLERVRKQFGKVFRTNQPDMFSAVAVAAVTEKWVSYDGPLSLNAMSSRSNGASLIMSSGLRDEAKAFYLEGGEGYSKELIGSLSPGDFGNAIPAVIADQFLVASQFSPKVPKPTWNTVITAVANYSSKALSKERYVQISNVAKEIGRLNQLTGFAEAALQRHVFRPRIRVRSQTEYRAPLLAFETIDLKAEGIVDAAAAATFVGDLLLRFRGGPKCAMPNSASHASWLPATPAFVIFMRRLGFRLTGRLLVISPQPEAIADLAKHPPSRVIEVTPITLTMQPSIILEQGCMSNPYSCAFVAPEGNCIAAVLAKISELLSEGALVWILVPINCVAPNARLFEGYQYVETIQLKGTTWEALSVNLTNYCKVFDRLPLVSKLVRGLVRRVCMIFWARLDVRLNRSLNWQVQLWRKI